MQNKGSNPVSCSSRLRYLKDLQLLIDAMQFVLSCRAFLWSVFGTGQQKVNGVREGFRSAIRTEFPAPGLQIASRHIGEAFTLILTSYQVFIFFAELHVMQAYTCGEIPLSQSR
jgi:hypothetical protein